MAAIVLERLSRRFPDGTVAVDSLDLAVDDGELLVLVGPSGCGKTTALRMIAGLDSPTGGTVRIGGHSVGHLAPKDRDVAMVFQSYTLYPHLTARENMAFPLRLRGLARDQIARKVEHAAAKLGIERLLERRPAELSGGQRQRVALGRAVVREPACFLFDEPLASLDPALRLQMRAELKRLHSELGITTLYVTHDQEEAMTLGHRVAVMERGRLRQVGPPLDVYRRPANRFVAGFFGLPPMNFLEGRLQTSDGRLWFDAGTFRLPLAESHPSAPAAASGQPVVLGVRPEDLRRCTGSEAGFEAVVEQVEELGDRTHVRLTAGRHRGLVARWEEDRSCGPGTCVTLHVASERLHLFAADDHGERQDYPPRSFHWASAG